MWEPEYETQYVPSAEEELIVQLKKMLGYVPVGTKDLLHILAHPDVIFFTKAYIKEREQ